MGLIEQKYTYKLKKLLEVICESKPFEVNYTKIASMAEISRVKLYDYIRFLDEGELLLLIDESFKQIKDIENSFVVADDVDVGFGNKIPLWIFGFLY